MSKPSITYGIRWDHDLLRWQGYENAARDGRGIGHRADD